MLYLIYCKKMSGVEGATETGLDEGLQEFSIFLYEPI